MNITFLGTGTSQGVPVIGCTCEVCLSSNRRDKRLRCAALIQDGPSNILIDGGPDIRYQLLRAGVTHLEALLLTHEHYDHTGGLDDLRPLIFIKNEPLPIYLRRDVSEIIKLKYDYAFGEQKYPGAPRFELIEIQADTSFHIGSSYVKPLRVIHGELSILGYQINNKLAYITDANQLPESTLKNIQGVEVLVINALHHRPHHSHFTLDQTLEVIKQVSPKSTYIIHMSHYMGLYEDVQAKLPQNVYLAYDQLKLDLMV